MVEKKMLGASLYVPATHKDLQKIALGELLGEVRSLIFCTEDAVADNELHVALLNLAHALQELSKRPGKEIFVRVRNPDVLRTILKMHGSEKLSGFVLPKISRQNFDFYFRQVRETNHLLMPTLETVDVFDEIEMKQLRQYMEQPDVRRRILALRIGGNDLLALLGIRRPRTMTIYHTPLGHVISRLATTFLPFGFALTAPVFEHLDNLALLAQEIHEDLAHGLMGKTAIHPSQVNLIEQHYRVQESDVEMAMRLVNPACPTIFKMQNSMCEVATHRAWAYGVIEQARHFGTHHACTSRADDALTSIASLVDNSLEV